ncbi:hypothetical protein L8106_11382 [Lyngbya sp. PCC 8106]|nr:hypothetical protein L8106_11382 [Lyngbya sp. PCC 8106]
MSILILVDELLENVPFDNNLKQLLQVSS